MIYSTKESRTESLLRKIRNSVKEINEAAEKFEKAQLSQEDATNSTADTTNSTADIISRQAAIDLVKDVCDAVMSGCESWYDPETGDEVYKDIREVDAILKCNKEVRIALRKMSPAQPEREEGEWIYTHPVQSDDSGAYMCSKCKTGMWEIRPSSYHYCPNCGIKMKGVKHETN